MTKHRTIHQSHGTPVIRHGLGTNHNETEGIHIDKIQAANGQAGYIVYLGGTGFTSKQTWPRNWLLFTDAKLVDPDPKFLSAIKDAVRDENAPIMLVGFTALSVLSAQMLRTPQLIAASITFFPPSILV